MHSENLLRSDMGSFNDNATQQLMHGSVRAIFSALHYVYSLLFTTISRGAPRIFQMGGF